MNIGGIRTEGVDLTFNVRTAETGAGVFCPSVIGSYLVRYTETVPATDSTTVTRYTGFERGSPDQASPRFKGLATID